MHLSAGSDITFRILGRLESFAGNRPLVLGSSKQRIVLGLLLCRANQIVPVSTLIDALWDGLPPRSAHKNIQGYVSGLRGILTPDAEVRLDHSPPGYTLAVPDDRLDALRFRALVQAGRQAARAGDTEVAADVIGQGLRLWRPPILPDLEPVPAIAAEVERLREQYLTAYEDWAELTLELGRPAELADRLDELADRHPFRERLQHVLMLALYRSGRQTEALARFDTLRMRLAQELGLDPSAQLTRLHESMLSADPVLSADPRPRPSAPAMEHTSLPRDAAHFVGRTDAIAAVETALRAPGRGTVVAISGGAGVGKTALAVHCAHGLGDRFTDGRILIQLRASGGEVRPTEEILAELLRKAGRTGPPPPGRDERAELLRETMAARAMLVVLDDAVDHAQARAVLAAVGDAAAVVTSRRHLAALDSALDLTLTAFADAEALELLGRLIGPERMTAEPEKAWQLVDICGGLPLAVRIVGSRLAGLRHLSLARFADRLADEDRMLDELVAGDLQIRSRLDVAYRELPPAGRAILLELLPLAGGAFTAGVAAARLGASAAQAEAAIEQLIEAHLVDAHAAEVIAHGGEPAQFSLPTLVRVFLRERGAVHRP